VREKTGSASHPHAVFTITHEQLLHVTIDCEGRAALIARWRSLMARGFRSRIATRSHRTSRDDSVVSARTAFVRPQVMKNEHLRRCLTTNG
jgi:hypothetical protein